MAHRGSVAFLALCAVLALAACQSSGGSGGTSPSSTGDPASAPAGSALETFLAQGASHVTPEQFIQLNVGKTHEGEGWAVYHDPNGSRIFRITRRTQQTVLHRAWRVVGELFCVSPIGELNDNAGPGTADDCTKGENAYVLNDTVILFAPDGSVGIRFTVHDGNPLGLE